ncbi:MAG: D-2-hydroxyacid dehydrogenase [Solirubrobacteraceae bacterium]
MIATPLEAKLVEQVKAADPRVEVLYEPELLPPTRFPGDHRGIAGFIRTLDGERRWHAMLHAADVLFGIPGDTSGGLTAVIRECPKLRWVQATATGAGEQVRAADLTREELERVIVTSARGVHAGPLAEFALFGLLAFARGLPRLLADQRAHRWDHYPVCELRGDTMLIVGLGKIGAEVARLASAFAMQVIGINRSGHSDSPHVTETYASDALDELLPRADAIVITLPLTEETSGLIGPGAFARMKAGAILVNVGRGGVIDEDALVRALRDGRLRGAALDVFATEPLPAHSRLWELPNVLLSPHTAGLSVRENERIVELFVENIGRYLRGEELHARVHPTLFY